MKRGVAGEAPAHQDTERICSAGAPAGERRPTEGHQLVDELRSTIPDFNLEYAVLDIGEHLSRATKLDDEIVVYEASLDELPDSYRLRYYLASAFEGKGNVAGAIGACRQALELRPDHPAIKGMMERLGADPGNLS